MNSQQRQYGAAPRRRARSPAAPTPVRSARRRPEWNTYLTDAEQYKLNQQQQLQRQLQQLSTAHFVSRSPTHLSFADRPRRPPVGDRGARSASGTPWPVTPLSTPSGQSIAGVSVRSSAGKTARRLQFADMPLTPMSERHRQQRFASAARSPHINVSFYSDDADAEEATPRRCKLDVNEKASLQSELAVLERMLWDLEAETERLGLQPQTPRGGERAGGQNHNTEGPDDTDAAERFAHEEEEGEDDGERDDGEDEDDDDNDRGSYGMPTARRISFDEDTLDDATVDRHEDDSRLGEICHRSLSTGLALARKVGQLSKKMSDENRNRQDQELKVEVLEQELRATQAKCNYLEAKYDNVATQLDDMREAVIATDAAIHRMAQAFEKTRFHSGRSSTPSTPHKHAMNTGSMTPLNRKQPAKSSLKQTPRPSTPSRETYREQLAQDESDGAENRSPNSNPH